MYKFKSLFVVFFLWVGLGFYGQAQEAGQIQDAGRIQDVRLVPDVGLARSSPDYRVTPGDVYTLTFLMGGHPVVQTLVVDTDYRIRVANLGIVNGRGQTFVEVRRRVEAIVTNNHPLSGPQLVITQPAVFMVFVNGEVYMAEERSAWGLTRLSSLIDEIDENLTTLASTRNVTIRSPNGQPRVYDLFQFWRFGEQTQNPYLRPGDTVTFNRISRHVTIQGQVERPGTYQLLEGENLRELVELYGNNFTPFADLTRVSVLRRVGAENISGNRIFLTLDHLENNFVLEHYDLVYIPANDNLLPVMFVEGAVGIDITADLVTTNRVVVRFHAGETYAAMVRRNMEWFSAVSDTENAYVVRLNGEIIPLNLNRALFDAFYRGEVLIQNHDTLIIPFRQFFVTVAGAVANPGRYPFIPGRGWEYYIALAGGFAAGRNTRDRVIITDINGRRLGLTEPITPETVITARTNHPLYFFNQYAPIVTTVLSIVTAFLTVMMVRQQ